MWLRIAKWIRQTYSITTCCSHHTLQRTFLKCMVGATSSATYPDLNVISWNGGFWIQPKE